MSVTEHNICRFVETKRLMDFNSPGSQAKEGSFFGLEASLEGLEPGYDLLVSATSTILLHLSQDLKFLNDKLIS